MVSYYLSHCMRFHTTYIPIPVIAIYHDHNINVFLSLHVMAKKV